MFNCNSLKYSNTVKSLANESPIIFYLGVNKTHRRVLSDFYWPGVSKEVKNFCI